MTKTAELTHLFRALKAPAAARALPKLAERAREEEWSHERFLEAVLSTEVSSRESEKLASNDPAFGSLDDAIDDVRRQPTSWLVQPDEERLQELHSTGLHPVHGHLRHGEAATSASRGLDAQSQGLLLERTATTPPARERRSWKPSSPRRPSRPATPRQSPPPRERRWSCRSYADLPLLSLKRIFWVAHILPDRRPYNFPFGLIDCNIVLLLNRL